MFMKNKLSPKCSTISLLLILCFHPKKFPSSGRVTRHVPNMTQKFHIFSFFLGSSHLAALLLLLTVCHKNSTFFTKPSHYSPQVLPFPLFFYDYCPFCSSRERDLPGCSFCRSVQTPSFLQHSEAFPLSLGYGFPRTQSPRTHLLKRFHLCLQ